MRYNAVSNLSFGGLPVSVGRPPEEQAFATQAEAAAWLRALKCGGSISAHVDGDFRVVEEIRPGS